MREMGAVSCILPVLFLLQLGVIHCDNSLAAADYVVEEKHDCHFHNGTQRVRYLDRVLYNQVEIVYFDSDVGRFVARTELGRPDADAWNRDKDYIEQRSHMVETFCKPNYAAMEIMHAIGRRVPPSVQVSLMPNEDFDNEQHMLMCNVFGFFPSEIKVKWYRNGQEETEQVQSTELFQNGDWTFQIHVMLEDKIQKGDNYTCEVYHISLASPYRVTWKPETSVSARNKQVTGIVGIVLGTVFIVVGLVMYIRGWKVQTTFHGPQTQCFVDT